MALFFSLHSHNHSLTQSHWILPVSTFFCVKYFGIGCKCTINDFENDENSQCNLVQYSSGNDSKLITIGSKLKPKRVLPKIQCCWSFMSDKAQNYGRCFTHKSFRSHKWIHTFPNSYSPPTKISQIHSQHSRLFNSIFNRLCFTYITFSFRV